MRKEVIMKYVTAQGIKCWKHNNRMGRAGGGGTKTKRVRKISEWNPMAMGSKGSPKKHSRR
jgi:hypothetical protein